MADHHYRSEAGMACPLAHLQGTPIYTGPDWMAGIVWVRMQHLSSWLRQNKALRGTSDECMEREREGARERGREDEMKGGREGRLCKGESHLLLLRECEIGRGNWERGREDRRGRKRRKGKIWQRCKGLEERQVEKWNEVGGKERDR